MGRDNLESNPSELHKNWRKKNFADVFRDDMWWFMRVSEADGIGGLAHHFTRLFLADVSRATKGD